MQSLAFTQLPQFSGIVIVVGLIVVDVIVGSHPGLYFGTLWVVEEVVEVVVDVEVEEVVVVFWPVVEVVEEVEVVVDVEVVTVT